MEKGLLEDIKRRFSPLAIFVDIRILPITLSALLQCRSVFLWLLLGDPSVPFALIGSAFLESMYIGLAAWADRKQSGRWVLITELGAMSFSMGIALNVYWGQGYWAILHMCPPVLTVLYLEAIRTRLLGMEAEIVVPAVVQTSAVVAPVTGTGYLFKEPPIYTWSENKPMVAETEPMTQETPKQKISLSDAQKSAKSEAARRGHENRRLRQLEAEQKQPISMTGRG